MHLTQGYIGCTAQWAIVPPAPGLTSIYSVWLKDYTSIHLLIFSAWSRMTKQHSFKPEVNTHTPWSHQAFSFCEFSQMWKGGSHHVPLSGEIFFCWTSLLVTLVANNQTARWSWTSLSPSVCLCGRTGKLPPALDIYITRGKASWELQCRKHLEDHSCPHLVYKLLWILSEGMALCDVIIFCHSKVTTQPLKHVCLREHFKSLFKSRDSHTFS